MLIETGLTLASDVECSFCLYLPSGGTKGVCHHSWPKLKAWIWSLASFLHGQLQLGTMRTSDFFFSSRAISDQSFKATQRVSSQSPEMKKRQKSNAALVRWNWTFWFYPSTGFYRMLGETAGYLSPGAHVPWGKAQYFSRAHAHRPQHQSWCRRQSENDNYWLTSELHSPLLLGCFPISSAALRKRRIQKPLEFLSSLFT